MSQDAMTLVAPAKLNLYLDVGAVRSDGYHDVTTVYHALELCDTVTLTPAEGLVVSCEPEVGASGAQNTAHRAAQALAAEAGRTPDVCIRIEKRVPHGAGLGGGSSDAAAVIAGLAQWWGLDPGGRVAMRAAAQVGADVSFFLVGGAAIFDGFGERFVRELPARDYHVVLAKVDEPASTAEVYRVFDTLERQPASGPSAVADALRNDDLRALAAALHNGLADAAGRVTPAMSDVVSWLSVQEGVAATQVAGSGSTVFGLCLDAEHASSAARAATERGLWSVATRLSRDRAMRIQAGDGR